MNDTIEYLRTNPWLPLFLVFGLAVWIAALVVIFRSPKFLRKWLWVLLSIFSFSYSWRLGDGITMSAGFPIGSLYVLWFWKFGKWPTSEEIERHRTRITPKSSASKGSSLLAIKLAYFAAAAAAIVVSGLIAFGGFVEELFEPLAASPAGEKLLGPSFLALLKYGDGVLVVILAFVFLFLAFRPYWWGKFICWWAGIAWTGFAAGFIFLFGKYSTEMAIIFLCGAVITAAGIIHQVIDPRFGGSYPQLKSAGSKP